MQHRMRMRQKRISLRANTVAEGKAIRWAIEELANSIRVLQYKFIGREANSMAHNLAHYVLDSSSEFVWVEDVPPSISVSVLQDVGQLSSV
ncbi:conserved hypothetical protein [Ricinus communis]|uniref:RNase H type-1 domain-containing protein n=1 Tax=Ricinus communis TaxID=3988 RepID=B9S533_RICCO|nr:conserved hypothetical protein [Ricinus communis]